MKLRKNGGTSKESGTTLQVGDKCTWFKGHGTIGFHRDGDALRRPEPPHDDKYMLCPQNWGQFQMWMEMIAELSNLVVVWENDTDNLGTVRFEKPSEKSEE